MVVAELQAITFNEFLPALLGEDAIAPYDGYDPTVNPGIANEFSTAAYRLGHSMLNNEVEFIGNNLLSCYEHRRHGRHGQLEGRHSSQEQLE